MKFGRVKWFNADKGYGFIEPASGGADVFVHATALLKAGLPNLNDGQRISYEITEDSRRGKLLARNLHLL